MQTDKQEILLAPRHGSVIDALAKETGGEPAHVRELYERELARLETTAKVRGFITLLACRNVRMALRQSNARAN
jgi:hypothetical protein